ncbi:MAG TPA: hypothetical protein VMM18_10190 [Gemmatimonadaceae bacterium]|nr:hypothetical protein [Gemmatimonadaceae bacterium]
MRTSILVRALGLGAALALPTTLIAQQRPATTQRAAASQPAASARAATPFRGGQWGAEFAASDDFQSVGMVRLLSPVRALAFDVSFATMSSDVDGSDAEQSASTYGLSLGYRIYRGVASNVVGSLTAGGLINSASSSNTTGAGATTETTARGWGPFAELGASYFITPHLSLGAAYGLQLVMVNSKTEGPGGTTESSGHVLGTSPLSVRVGLYF